VDGAATQARAVLARLPPGQRSRTLLRDQVTRAQEELDQLRALQHQVAEQLTGVRSLLDWTLPRVTSSGAPLSGMPPQAASMPAPAGRRDAARRAHAAAAHRDAAGAALRRPVAGVRGDLRRRHRPRGRRPGRRRPDDVRVDEAEPEREPVSTPSSHPTETVFPSTAEVRAPQHDVDVPEPRTADDDESDRPSPGVRPGRLAARISSRR
jgi:hypothetical protein